MIPIDSYDSSSQHLSNPFQVNNEMKQEISIGEHNDNQHKDFEVTQRKSHKQDTIQYVNETHLSSHTSCLVSINIVLNNTQSLG